MLTSIEGMKVGHHTDAKAVTGCTVILCPPNTVGSCEIRGSAPGSRETELLHPMKAMNQVNAILLTGGSAFGLAAADGVMKYLSERNVGYETPWIRVPIVPAAVIFDLNIGTNEIRPTADDAYRACENATEGAIERGSVGAGTGATVGKWRGIQYWMKGGIGAAELRSGDLIVAALAVVNAVGDVYDERGKVIAGARHPGGGFWAEVESHLRYVPRDLILGTNTTLIVIGTNAKLSKPEVHKLCQRASNGMARAINPVNTTHDGDCIFGLATGTVDMQFDIVAEMGAEVTAAAIRDGVRAAQSLGGVPALM